MIHLRSRASHMYKHNDINKMKYRVNSKERETLKKTQVNQK